MNALYLSPIGLLSSTSAPLQMEIMQLFIMYTFLCLSVFSFLEKLYVRSLKVVHEDPIIPLLKKPKTNQLASCGGYLKFPLPTTLNTVLGEEGSPHTPSSQVEGKDCVSCSEICMVGEGMGYGIKGELSIRAVPDLFSPRHTQLQYKV